MNRILYTIIIILLAGAGLTTDAQVVDTVCKGAGGVKYSIVPRKGSVYIWAVTGGNIIADRDSFIIVDWGTTEGIFEIKTYEITKNGCLGEAVISQILVTKESFSESVNSHEHVLNLNNPSNKKGVVWQKME